MVGPLAEIENGNSVQSNNSHKAVSLLLILILLFYCFLKVWGWGAQAPRDDFYQMWRGGMLIENEKVNEIYSPILQGYHAGTPFLYTIFSAFSSGDFAVDYRIYRHLIIICGMLAIGFFCHYLKYPLTASIAAIVVFTEWFQPFLTDIHVANVNSIQLALLVLFLLMQRKQSSRIHNMLGGAVLGFAVMFKPNLIFALLMVTLSWLINRKLKKLMFETLGFIVAVMIAVGLSSWAFGSVLCWRDWMGVIRGVGGYMLPIESGNFGLAMLIFEKFGIRSSSYLAALLFLIAALFVWAGNRKPAEGHINSPQGNDEEEIQKDFLMVAVGCLICLLSSPLVWVHYYVLAIPAAIFGLRPRPGAKYMSLSHTIGNIVPVVLAIVLIAEFPIRTLFAVTDSDVRAFLLCVGTLILFSVAMKDIVCHSADPS